MKYKIYHKGNPLGEIATFPNAEMQIWPIHVSGIESIRLPDGELTITCPVEDVRVEMDGKPAILRLVNTMILGDLATYSSYQIELPEPEEQAMRKECSGKASKQQWVYSDDTPNTVWWYCATCQQRWNIDPGMHMQPEEQAE